MQGHDSDGIQEFDNSFSFSGDVILLKRKSNGTSQERATCSIKQSDCNLIICKDRHQLQTGKQRRHRIDV